MLQKYFGIFFLQNAKYIAAENYLTEVPEPLFQLI
jgi:hypothetical protein